MPDVKLSVGVESGPTTTPGCLLFKDCCSDKTSLPYRSKHPPLTLPSSSSSKPGTSALNLRFSLIQVRTWVESFPSSLLAFSMTIRPLGSATSRYTICLSGGYLLCGKCCGHQSETQRMLYAGSTTLKVAPAFNTARIAIQRSTPL